MLKEEIKYQNVTSEFEKNRDYEEFIEAFNEYLAPFEEQRYRDLAEAQPSVHVIGVPRSGTTMMTQLIISQLEVGYINNLIARFWKAPVSAIRISRQLLGDDYRSSLSSNLGKTEQIYEPNEFNYFWYDMLGYKDHSLKTNEEAKEIDWDRVGKAVKNILWAFEKPVVFKSFMLGWHAKLMQQTLKKTCFIWIRRDPTDNALSLLGMRRKLFGTIDKWGSFKPLNYEELKGLTPHQQVAGQVHSLEKSYQTQLDQLPSSNYVVLQYEDVCREPVAALESVKNLIESNGGDTKLHRKSISPQQPSRKSPDTHHDYKAVHQAVKSFYS